MTDDTKAADSPSSEDVATAESQGREAAKTGGSLADGLFDSPQESSARERGNNEQRTADAAEKTADAAEKAADKDE